MIKRTGRALGYLITGPVAGLAGFVWSTVAGLLVTVLAVTQLRDPAFLGAAWVTRHLARAERRRAGWVLGARIPDPYLAGTPVVAQPATWRDLAWLVLLLPIGVATGVAGVVTAAVDAAAILAPAVFWAVPNPHAPFPMRPLLTTVPGRIGLTVLGLALLPVAARLVRALAAGPARLAAVLLGPGEHGRLVARAERLAETRRRVVDAQAAELRRIERDLHDGAQARIVAAGMTLALAARKLRAAAPPASGRPDGGGDPRTDVELARRQLDDALAELRRLVRGIHPPILTDRGLHAALAALAGDSPFPVALHGDAAARYPAAVESAAYFVVAEGLTNAAKHAGAASGEIDLGRVGGVLRVTVTDDGRGGADPAGAGLVGLRRRVEALDGTLTVTSPPGGPTRLVAELPWSS
ncbi:histidine kinase [Actinoplanes sp. SE50]|uniref:sensor histidine kinase n=1 Tax=unclassified Actinoplanes TaxID=2626549 RepID=UPI00023EC6D1|nr:MULTISPECIES: sensor histidine kinase [unclassified Actinoplanes]AEV87612.1 histidine kinase [Actinoplanes sp. SE50/110]ATO86015.1 histidine kinase [Actinoplanes sp. SE50]SLM03429.1 histidine kinase [Actinoplanes sp. SE50/110]